MSHNFKRTTFTIIASILMMAPYSNVFAQETGHETTFAYTTAKSQMDASDYKDAIKTIVTAQTAGEDNFSINQLLVEAYNERINQVGMLKKRGLATKMKAAMEHSLQLNPSDIQAMENLIEFHLQAPSIVGGDKAKAETIIADLAKRDAFKGHLLSARLAMINKDMAAVQSNLDAADALKPGDTEIMMMQGRAHNEQKNYAAAIATYEVCVKSHPDHMQCRYQLGRSAQIGDIEHDKGKAAFIFFIENQTEDKNLLAYAHYRLGNLYAQTGDSTTARKHYETAVEVDDLKDARKAITKLK